MANAAFEQVIELVLQTSGDPEVLKLAAAIKELNSTAEVSDDAMGDFVRQLDELQKAAAASAGLERLTQRTQQLEKEQGTLADAVERAGLRLQLQAQVQQESADALERARAASAKVRAEQQLYAESGGASVLVQQELKAAIKETSAAQKEAERAYQQTTTALNGATRDYERAAEAQGKLDTNLSSARTNLEAAQKASEGLGKSQGDLAQAIDIARERAALNAQVMKSLADSAQETARRLAEGDEKFKRFADAGRTSAEALKAYRERADQAAASTESVSRESSLAGNALGKLKEIAAGVFAFFSVGAAVDQIKQIVTGASDAEQQLAQLEAALASTGRQGEFSAQQLVQMANSLRDVSLFSPDQIQSAQTRLLTYTNIVGEQFPQAMQIALDQSQRLGIGVEQSAELVGRALQSPSKAMEALGRQGFTLEAGQKELLKTLEETGRTAEAQAIIIDLLTESYGGAAAAARLNTFAGLIKGIRDQFADFQQTVADQGVFDFLKQQLVDVNAELKRLAADGTLTQYAKSVSDGIVATAEAVKSAVIFVRDYSGALILLGKAYLAVKFAPFVAGLAASAQGMVAAAVQARTLTGVVGGLGARLAAIPANIKIAIGIVAFDFLIGQFRRLQDAISQYRESLNEIELFEAGQRQLALDRVALIEQIIQVYGKYADTQIQSQEQLNALGEGDLLLYRQRLEAAERYFAAVQAKAREANDAAALEDARRRLGEFRAAQEAVAEAFSKIERAKQAAFADQSQARDLAAALGELGVSAQNGGTAITQEGEKILGVFARIVTNAEATGAQIGEAFNNALGRGQTVAEVERLGDMLKVAFDKGSISAEQFATLMDATKSRINAIEEAASKAAGSFQQIVDAGEAATRALLATLEASRTQLATKANQLAGEIARGLRAGIDTSALQAELGAVESKINDTTVEIGNARQALSDLGDEADRTGPRLGNAAGQGTQAFGQLSEAIGQTRSSFETYQEAESRGAKKSEEFAADKRVYTIRQLELDGELLALRERQIEAEGRLIQQGVPTSFYEAQVRRNLDVLREYGEELDRIAARSEALRAQEEAIQQQAEADRLARINASLQQAEQLTQTEERRAVAQQAAAAAITAQLTATRELVSLRERNANTPERVEVILKNEQRTADQLLELIDRDADRIAALVANRIAGSRTGTFGR